MRSTTLSLPLLFLLRLPLVSARARFYVLGFSGPPAVAFLIASAVLFVGLLFGAYGCYRYQQRNNWNRRVEQAEEEILQEGMRVQNKTSTLRGATYTISYKERNGDECTSKGTLEFRTTQETFETTSKNGKTTSHTTNCLFLSGHGTNQNGSFVIKRGRIAPSGRCCWLEETTEPKGSCGFFKESKQVLATANLSSGVSQKGQGKWASYHELGGVTDGKLEQLELLNKVGGGSLNW